MNLCHQIKKYRTERNLSQKDLAEKIYVSTQTISNWENERSYPDIQNLLLMSVLFDVTLDDLVKGDVEEMKQSIQRNEMGKWSWVMTICMLLAALSMGVATALFDTFRWWGMMLPAILWGISCYGAIKVEKIKKEENIQTYREIIAYYEGSDIEEQRNLRDKKKDSKEKILIIVSSSVIVGIITVLSILIADYLS